MRKNRLATTIVPLAQGTSMPTAHTAATKAKTMVTVRRSMLYWRKRIENGGRKVDEEVQKGC
jgi:uncharacterized protein GlcG (DUF336 family)